MTVLVISPHLDDAVMSIGATLHNLVQRNIDVHVVTVFAGDPHLDCPASYWDARRGVKTAAEATALRREEDQRASSVLGITTTWLPFDDGAYVSLRDPAAIWARLRPLADAADCVLTPGWPLTHPDHRWITKLVVERLDVEPRLAFYAELPYAAQPLALVRGLLRGTTPTPLCHALGEELDWVTSSVTSDDLRAKKRAVAAYQGEIDSLGIRAVLGLLHDLVLRRERLGHRRSTSLPAQLRRTR